MTAPLDVQHVPNQRPTPLPDPKRDPLVSLSARGNFHLQVVSSHSQRSIIERERAMHCPQLAGAKTRGEAPGNLSHATCSLADKGARNLVRKLACLRTWSIRIGKYVHVRQRGVLEKRGELLEISTCLTGEADDDVGAQRGVRDLPANAFEQRRVSLDGVGAAHGCEHAGAGVLQGQMKVGRETGALAEMPDDLASAVHRFEGADSELDVRVTPSIGDGSKEIRQ